MICGIGSVIARPFLCLLPAPGRDFPARVLRREFFLCLVICSPAFELDCWPKQSVHVLDLGKNMPPEVKTRLGLFPKMSKTQLAALWSELLDVPLPRGTRRTLLIRILAFRIQEQAYGGLSPA